MMLSAPETKKVDEFTMTYKVDDDLRYLDHYDLSLSRLWSTVDLRVEIRSWELIILINAEMIFFFWK